MTRAPHERRGDASTSATLRRARRASHGAAARRSSGRANTHSRTVAVSRRHPVPPVWEPDGDVRLDESLDVVVLERVVDLGAWLVRDCQRMVLLILRAQLRTLVAVGLDL